MMESSGTGKSPNTSLSFRYNANNEQLEELGDVFEDDPPTPVDASPIMQSESASPKKGDKTPSILDKYFKSMRSSEKFVSEKDEKERLEKSAESKISDDSRSTPREVSSSPVKDYLKNLGKRSVSESTEVKDVASNETWKIFHDFKFKIAQAVEDMKTRSLEETKEKEKSVPRDSSISDSEENSVIKDSDQSVGDTDNQVSSLNSSLQNLSEMTHPLTARATEPDLSLPYDKNVSDASDDTQKNIVQSEKPHETDTTYNEPNLLEVESGVEALEDGIDGFSDAPQHISFECDKIAAGQTLGVTQPNKPPPPNLSHVPKQIDNKQKKDEERKPIPFFNLTLYFLTIVVLVNFVLFPEYRSWNGFVLGIWVFYFSSQVKEWVLATYFRDWEPSARSTYRLNRNSAVPVPYTIPSVKEYTPIKKYEGWVNHYRFPEYDPLIYSVNKTITAFMKLEGCNLRISYTKTKIPKRALWDEKPHKVVFYMHRLYNLTGAKVMLLPKGLVRRRQWSKKYPICIVLNENENIQVLEKENLEKKPAEVPEKKKDQPNQQETETAETNTSPEKKRKFVWRRKDKSNVSPVTVTAPLTPTHAAPSTPTHSENESGREGLRHRLVRKKHRDKKADSPSTATDNLEIGEKGLNEKTQPEEAVFHDAETDLASKSNTSHKEEAEDEGDEELTLIKEVLAETELDAPAVDGASEGEWSVHTKHYKESHQLFLFTRTGRDKHEWFRRLKIAVEDAEIQSAENSAAEEKSGAEQSQESKDGIEMAVYKVGEKENVAFANLRGRKSAILVEGGVEGPAYQSCEKTFWPFLLKILQQKPQIDTCDCRMLPSEVTWLNAMLARIIYDMIHNENILHRVQMRIQRKLHTLKLPSFMSPLMVTDLSLAGACPLVESVCAPTWDERGVWFDADLRYDGGAYISILTQINLMKLKEKNMTLEEQLLHAQKNLDYDMTESTVSFSESFMKRRKPAVYDSDLEDSAESSEDDSPPIAVVDSNDNLSAPSDNLMQTASEPVAGAPGSSKKKFLRMVDKIATNKYFQQVTDYKYVKRAMEGLSNMDIKLQLEVQGLEGRLAINMPPPPHDRIWFGFRTNPQLLLKARPAVGARSVRFAQITNWIEHRLSKEFEKLLVLPNMEDIIVDMMTATPIYDD